MSGLPWDAQLDSIFSEGPGQAREREGSAFDEAVGPFKGSLVIYGAGNLGRKVLRGLRENGLEAAAFADANVSLSGKRIDGLPVFSPQDAVRKLGRSAAFVVCVWHPEQQSGVRNIMDFLLAAGARFVLPFPYLFWRYPCTFLPYYLWDLPSTWLAHQGKIRRAYQSFADEASRAQLVADLELRVLGHFRAQRLPCTGNQYFPTDLLRIAADDCFVDCGAYDGDTIRELVKESNGGIPRILAFEADPRNFSRLSSYLAARSELSGRVTLRQAAVARANGTLRFAATASSNAAVSDSGETTVACVALDDALAGESPSMIKMDIEGCELDALEGATRVIASHEPILAICVYHRPQHLWEIPLWLNDAEPGARLHLRSYSVDGFESVCYAVPEHRALCAAN